MSESPAEFERYGEAKAATEKAWAAYVMARMRELDLWEVFTDVHERYGGLAPMDRVELQAARDRIADLAGRLDRLVKS
jgi:hypothetical protein